MTARPSLKDLEKRLASEPENLGLRVTVAGALLEAGRQAEAVELYRSVAIAYRDQGRGQQAIAVCRAILEIAPDDASCHALLAVLVANHRARTARESASPYGEDVLEVGMPPLGEGRAKPPSAPPIANGSGAQARVRETTVPPIPRSFARSDETPLPVPMPYHLADPTTHSLEKLSQVDLRPTPDPDELPVSEDAKTLPGRDDADATRAGRITGLSSAARRITNALATSSDTLSVDLSTELDTRQRPRIDSSELAKLEVLDDDDDVITALPRETRKLRAPVEANDDEHEADEDEDGVPTLSDDEITRTRDTPLDVMIRTEAMGPLGSAFFQPLPETRRGAVLARFQKKSVAKGTTVIRQGELGHSLVVVVKGELEARVERKGGPIAVGIVVTGEFVGEGSLLARVPSPVQVIATANSELLMLAPRDFYEIAGAFPALWAELKDVAERRKRELEAQLRR